MTEVIYINNEGDVCGLSNSILDNVDLGTKTVSRVSNIEFNHTIQLWEAVDADGYLIGRHKDRNELIGIERDYLNKKIETNYEKNQNSLP